MTIYLTMTHLTLSSLYTIAQQALEIEELKKVVNSLSSLIKEELLKAKGSSTNQQQSYSTTETTLPPASLTSPNQSNISVSEATQQTNADIATTITNILSEEREKHQLNLIVHQLAESTQEEPLSQDSVPIKKSGL